jgi:hypothetical protein
MVIWEEFGRIRLWLDLGIARVAKFRAGTEENDEKHQDNRLCGPDYKFYSSGSQVGL